MYTSGTTGVPKGVMLMHDNILRVVAAVSAHLGEHIKPGDVYLSFLPLAHVFDRFCADTYLSRGASIGYWQGNVKLLMSEIAALRPTGFFGVPRVFDRIYDTVMQRIQAGSPLKRAVFQACFRWKRMWMRLGWASPLASPLADALVFNKIKAALGGRCQFLFSGAAPLAAHVEEFLRVALCASAGQGFGLTETCAGSFAAPWDDYSHLGFCGAPLPCIEVRLEAEPEMGYSPSGRPARGELCLRGPSVFQGYFKQPDLTKEVFDSDGFFHTGDIAELREDGSMKIIDRRKNFFKRRVWVYGSSFESCLVAVVVPNEAALTAWAKASGRPHTDFKVLCDSEVAQQYVLDEMTAVSRAARLRGFEMVKAVHLDADPFSIEKELLTPTFKLKRPQLYARYKRMCTRLTISTRCLPCARASTLLVPGRIIPASKAYHWIATKPFAWLQYWVAQLGRKQPSAEPGSWPQHVPGALHTGGSSAANSASNDSHPSGRMAQARPAVGRIKQQVEALRAVRLHSQQVLQRVKKGNVAADGSKMGGGLLESTNTSVDRRMYEQVASSRNRLSQKLSTANQYIRHLEGELQTRHEQMAAVHKALNKLQLEVGVAASLADSAAAAVLYGLDKPAAAQKMADLGKRLLVLQQAVQQQASAQGNLVMREVPVAYYGVASEVRLMGDFDGWSSGVALAAEAVTDSVFTKFETTMQLLPGTYQVKWLVDGNWRLANDWPTATDSSGDTNNVLVVE
ncbi:hypothetical protein WJX72_010149 [[Myrmecia] bisecta]|uniref:AMP-dependent synthetase/ligase domain-containing protein n=1 Tax=[Myrmecia] bisecta TaxID=41462 RepID=A0AAW1QA32_9CHLO